MHWQNDNLQTTDSNLSWDVSPDELDVLEDERSEKQLSALVRNSYMLHLKRCLIKNFEKWSEASDSEARKPDESNIVKYAKLLEKKALRSCMLTNIYQKSMVQLISEIKAATQKKLLYNGFVDSIVQSETDSVMNRCDKSVQTDEIETLYTEFGPFLNSNHTGQEAKTIKRTESLDSYEELLNMLMSPTNTPKPVESPFANLPRQGLNKNNVLNNNKKESLNVDESEADFQSMKESNITRPPLDDRLQVLADLFADPVSPINIKEPERNNQPNNKLQIIENKIVQNKRGFEHHCHMQNVLPLDWSVELSAQECNLEIILQSLSPVKRIIVEKRFKDLFGNEDTDECVIISKEDKDACRKKIAAIVVAELTPQYKKGKISTRSVFKLLAKKITEQILHKSYKPQPEMVKKSVADTLAKVPQFNDVADLNYV
ncbi:uncharacterized protein LOC106661055 isoform X2 [Cimex lectularius]|uniref:Set2 Rpb1 interacting domain-containing protein n=1 Tax=Cimex lectularius TaxID=79782 RepID=A0A8I6SKC5_CIMLE|nr:uncharacterized protein LOC106661055 isoform X2 [Cimex lectularius]